MSPMLAITSSSLSPSWIIGVAAVRGLLYGFLPLIQAATISRSHSSAEMVAGRENSFPSASNASFRASWTVMVTNCRWCILIMSCQSAATPHRGLPSLFIHCPMALPTNVWGSWQRRRCRTYPIWPIGLSRRCYPVVVGQDGPHLST